MKAFLSNPQNKDNLKAFIFKTWKSSMPTQLNESQVLILAGVFKNHERAVLVSYNHTQELCDLY